MLFLEDLYAQKRPGAQDWRTVALQPQQQLQQHSQLQQERRDHLSVDSNYINSISSGSTERNDRTSVKRHSLFSRRRSTATNSSTDSQKRDSSVGAASRRSSAADMAVTENDSLKNKLLNFGLTNTKKTSGRKSDPTDVVGERENIRTHHRGSSVDSTDPISFISAPFGFQHIARIERSSRQDGEVNHIQIPVSPGTVPSTIFSPSKELQSSLARRTNRRPPPLRPKRPEESLIPQELLSPQNGGIPSIRQLRSIDPYSPPQTAPPRQNFLLPSLPPNYGAAPIPPRRSSKRLPPHLRENKLAHVKSAPQTFFRDSLSQDDFEQFPPYLDPNFGINRRDPLAPTPYLTLDPVSMQRPQLSPLFNPPLEQVPEEPEGNGSPGQMKDLKRQQSLRHAKSSPNMSRSSSRTMLHKITDELPPRFAELPPIKIDRLERPASQGSDTLGDLSRRSFSISKDSEGFVERSTTRDTAGSWEEDIEFCYNHAAEANCDFDWRNVSKFLDSDSTSSEDGFLPGDRSSREQRSSLRSHQSETMDLRDKSFLHQSFIPGPDLIPELDYRSAYTGSTNSLAVGTPQDKHRFPSIEGLRQSPPNSSQRKVEELLGITIPQVPNPKVNHRLDLDSDQLYDDLMSSYVPKETEQQNNSYLPTLEPTVYSRESSPSISQRHFPRGKPHLSPTSAPAPTSAPMTHSPRGLDYALADSPTPTNQTFNGEFNLSPISPMTPLASSLRKDLPPLPTTSYDKPIPLSLTVDSIVAQLRSPTESPTMEVNRGPYTPPASNHSSPPMPEFKPQRPSIRHKPVSPGVNSPNHSEDIVVSAIIAALPSPPESPDIPQLQLSGGNSVTPFPPSRIPIRSGSHTESFHSFPVRPSLLKKQPSMPSLRSPLSPTQKRVEFKTTDSAGSPIVRSSSGAGSEGSSKSGYSLFPSGTSALMNRPTRPRRSTAT